MTWFDLFERVCARFTRDRQEALVRQWFHIRQTNTVAEYVEKFDSLMHQLLAYEQSVPQVYFVQKFIDGLKDEVRRVVIVHRPQDMDTASLVALLQEEALEGVKIGVFRRSDSTNYLRPMHKVNFQVNLQTTPTRDNWVTQGEEKKGAESAKTKEDRLATLKSYRRSKGLCFTCGERWGKDHKCSPSVQLYVVQELLDNLQEDTEEILSPETATEEDLIVMAISQQTANGKESGSTNSFIDEQVGMKMIGVEELQHPQKVQIADVGQLIFPKILPGCNWCMQGHSFKNDFKLIPLGSYYIILGMDWLQQHSPMQIVWIQKWVEFQYQNQLIRLHGIKKQSSTYANISIEQLVGMAKSGAIMYLVKIGETTHEEEFPIPEPTQQVLQSYQDVFAEPKGLPPRRNCDHKIPLIEGAQPVNLRPYKYNPELKDEIEKQVNEMLESGVIQPSQSAWSSPALLFRKTDVSWRLFVDYRHLNALATKSKYPVPIIEELLD